MSPKEPTYIFALSNDVLTFCLATCCCHQKVNTSSLLEACSALSPSSWLFNYLPKQWMLKYYLVFPLLDALYTAVHF